MELMIADFPVYGARIKSGTVETLFTKEEVYHFLGNKETANKPKKLRINKKETEQKETGECLLAAAIKSERSEKKRLCL
jgi:hypothetical protein